MHNQKIFFNRTLPLQIILIIFIIFFSNALQIKACQTDTNEVYDNKIFNTNIKTVQLYGNSWEMAFPIIALNSNERLHLLFDDLSGEHNRYSYSFIHCNANWEKSELADWQYLQGFYENQINGVDFSRATAINYSHYQLTFPNDDVQFTKSGNYCIKIFYTNNPDSIVLMRRFCVYEPRVNISASIQASSIIEHRKYKQEIDFTLTNPSNSFYDPYNSIKVVILQNYSWQNAVTNLQPKYVKNNELIYDFDGDISFYANNEFRNFEIKSLKYRSINLENLYFDGNKFCANVNTDEKRTFKVYMDEKDINGKYLIAAEDVQNPETEADYVEVYFTLNCKQPINTGTVYIYGALTNWQLQEDFRMIYSPKYNRFSCKVMLKQGYYNYCYILKEFDGNIDYTFIEGTHSETENDYVFLVYQYNQQLLADELIGFNIVNSAIIK